MNFKKKYLKIRKVYIKMEQSKHNHQSVWFLTFNAAKGKRDRSRVFY